MKMDKKCHKFKELFISEDENALLEHVKKCPDCCREYENMKKVSGLISEVSFNFIRQRRLKKAAAATVAASFLMIFSAFFAFQIMTPESFVNSTIAYIQGNDCTYEEMGLPVDDYGLIMVDF